MLLVVKNKVVFHFFVVQIYPWPFSISATANKVIKAKRTFL